MKTILTRNKLAAAILMALSLLALALGVLLFGAPAAAQASGGPLSGTVIVMGTYYYGEPLTAIYSGGESVTWQWYRADASGNETPIPGATQTTYTVAVEDVGCSLYAEATAADDNYTGSVRGVTPYPMQRRSIVVKAHDETGTYGEEIQTLTASIASGSLAGGDTLEEIVTISTTATRNSTVGTYPIAVTPKGHPGYDVTCIGGTYTIRKAQVTVHTPDTGTITYGESLSEIPLSDGWEWVDGDIKPAVSDSLKTEYFIFMKVDDVNYDWDSVDGYDPESKIYTGKTFVTVLPKPLAAEMVSDVVKAYVYTGGAIKPAVTVQDGEALVPDTDYTVTYGANTTVAEGGTITVTGMGNYTGELVIKFSITQADPIYTLPENLSICVGHTLADVKLPGGWAWEDGALSVGAAGSHQFAAVFTPEDTQNYNTVKVQLTLTVGEHTGGTATCTEKAVCSACGEEYGELAAHTPETVPAKAATCTQTGLTEGSKCSVYGEMLQEQETISALNHDYTNVGPVWNWIGFASATASLRCTREGCGHVEVVTADITNEVTAAATCAGDGVRTYTATATFGGKTFTDRKTEVIPAKGHSPELVAGKAATCTGSGLTDGEKCSVCGETLQEQETIPALGHDLGEWTVTREPTHSAEGEEQRICSRCGKEETQAIPVLEGLSGGETAGVAVGSAVGTMLLAYGVLALLFKKGIVTGAFFIKIFPFIKP